jgi:hypothetical protein
MHEPTWAALTQRLERLEQENRQWKRMASLTIAWLGAVILIGATVSKKAKVPDELRTKRLVLADEAARDRTEFSVTTENRPALVLSDDAGKPRLMRYLSQYGEPTLSLADTGGKRRIVLTLDVYGTLLQFADEAGKLRAGLAVSAEGEPEMELLGRDDKGLWRAP